MKLNLSVVINLDSKTVNVNLSQTLTTQFLYGISLYRNEPHNSFGHYADQTFEIVAFGQMRWRRLWKH